MKHAAPRGGEAAPHWKAAREGRLVLPYCEPCNSYAWPLPAACPQCAGRLEWRQCQGRGQVVTYSVVHRAVDPALKDDVPYVVAIVALDEGPRLFTNIVEATAGAMRCGLRVKCRFEATLDPDYSVAVFAPE